MNKNIPFIEFCPTCCHDFKKKVSFETQFESEKNETLENFLEKIKKELGILRPQDNSPHYLPKKNPYCDEDGITLYTHADSKYFIEWNRVKDPADLLMFVHHLTEKVWINRRNIRYLIEAASFRHEIGYFKKTQKEIS